jgi:putative aminopeptidase FrvX
MSLNRKKYPGASELWIDVGLPAGEVAQLVRVGDLITIDAPPVDLRGERFAGKAMDNRASVAAVTWCLDALTRQRHAWDVVAVATVQEESYGTGAVTATYAVHPDLAIVIDGTFARQMGTNDDESFPLGSGPTLSQGPNFHPRLVKAIRQTATAQEIKLQVEIVPGDSGTDAWAVQVSREGVPTALLGIPMRSMHTPVEVVDLRDVARTGRLMAAFIAGLAPDFLDTWEDGQE